MNSKLYYMDPYIKTFSSKINFQEKDDNGQNYVVMEETCFYPTGGGQPFDTGLINNIPVINVEEIAGEIRHYTETPVSSVRGIVHGEIDWLRRFDHMQQHAGQHILSAAFEEIFDYHTVSFHLGQEVLTIDLDVDGITEEEAAAAEKRANQIILENRPIETRWIQPSEVSSYPLRKQLSVTDNIRLVIIPDFDYNGCGGTHPKSTGEILAIKILDWEKQKKKTRISFVCGNRVLQQLHRKHQVLSELTVLLNAPEEEMANSLRRLLEQMKGLSKQLDETYDRILQFEAKELITNQEFIQSQPIMKKVYQNKSMKELQRLASLTVNLASMAIILLVTENESGQLQIVMARGSELGVSMKKLLDEVLSFIGGRGGGNDRLAQGGVQTDLTGNQLLEIVINKIYEH
ncbi:alanyl-tRNA editing protein [Pseudoneobacillus sp. C159]